ncbi:amidophosphoribosyltransferase [Neisseria chenwenguii]|uniref:Amidophosphoribosyltransferase n=1 Tax=Neisseria chenwenguii TaxID=1853278 RepID=A0A220S1Q9_9NEIS|nr:amidophosphoribosyltransferase [Neisseria chenwenguii]
MAAVFTDAANSCPLCFRQIAGGAVCGACQKKPPQYARLWASVYYQPPVSGMIHEFKHLADSGMCRPLAALMRRNAPDWLETARIDCVLAMPLSKERRFYRGFNQSEALTDALAAHYGWRVLPRGTVVRKHTPPQSTLKSEARRRNVKNIFELKNPLESNCNVLLIDDVTTTGATFAELAKTLKQSGVGQVYCWSLARSQMKS